MELNVEKRMKGRIRSKDRLTPIAKIHINICASLSLMSFLDHINVKIWKVKFIKYDIVIKV
jgi:hypothetical protein